MKQLGNFFVNITGIGMIANGSAFADIATWNTLLNNIFLILFAIAVSMPILQKIKYFFNEWGNNVVYMVGKLGRTAICCYLLIMSSILLVDSTNNPFLYFRF